MRRIATVLLLICCAAFAVAEPRAVTPAEEEAVRLVFAHLKNGPSALWDAMSATSRIRKLGATEGRKEIELRVGPMAGSEWELVTAGRKDAESSAAFHVTFASGIDDTIVFAMAREGTAWKIEDIRSMSDAVASTAAAPQPVAPPKKELPLALMTAGIAAVLLGIGTFAVRPRFRVAGNAMAALTAVAFLSFSGLFYVRHRADAAKDVAAASVAGNVEKRSRNAMVELRRRAASGESIDAKMLRGLDARSLDRAALWNAQLHLQRNDFTAATAELAKMQSGQDTPLAQVLAGRMAFLLNKDVDAVLAYERAMELGPERDDLLYEMASVLMTLGFRDRAERYFRRLDEMGSREADAYYSLAVLDAMKNAEEKAEKSLLTAFRARPQLRSSLIKIGALYGLLRRPAVKQQLAMHLGEEPTIAPARMAERPLQIPPGASSKCVGEFLEIDLVGSKLQIPGGAFIAPAGTPVIDAGTWDRAEATDAITRAPALAKVASQPSSYAQPALSRRIVETATALAEHHRWDRVIELTGGVTASSELVPAELLLMKAEAHKRTGRTDAAKGVLRELIGRPALLKRLDARQLLEAGEMLAALGDINLAIRVMERAGQSRELPHLDDRIRQLMMNDRLATFSVHRTAHFAVRYSSDDTGKAGAENLGEIAEAEFLRLQKWIPILDLEPVTINMLSWDTFRGTYTGSDHILGFYDGQITVPFADVGQWPPEVVAILSHELAHAMIAQRTRDQAPRWFQEGFAQRIESVQFRRNPFNMYEPEAMVAIGLLDDVVMYSPDPNIVGQGYLVSQALIRYIESRWGQAGLNSLLDAFKNGSTTEEAIEGLGGGSLPAFNRAFVEWGQTGREVFENTDLVSYEAVSVTRGRRR